MEGWVVMVAGEYKGKKERKKNYLWMVAIGMWMCWSVTVLV